MSKHTPGPWRPGREDLQSYNAATGQPYSSVYTDDVRGGNHSRLGTQLPLMIATVHGEHVTREEEKANARLIARAPEMAELLEKAKHRLISAVGVLAGCSIASKESLQQSLVEMVKEIDAAIAKATGQQ